MKFDRVARRLGYQPIPLTVARGGRGNGVLMSFQSDHGLDIIIEDETGETLERNFEKTWFSDAAEVLFRNGKIIMLYWRSNE